ncbi:energy-coupled thiamine transporter ThiT [Lacticaseibacillus jixianensis]|uniref:Energy-coupled thiamine transporter ThiT n=1 Tax=Lacticaseibacillus jixianensis TaxID=2486012 RepID=A0ABW4B8C6_9LACO|nr:energy-coupled thiamine transporter ThiT [Lacticaseibacillus jixianensis]
MSNSNSRVLILVEIAVIGALAMALEYIPHSVGVSGINLSYGVVPITVLALRRGTGAGMAAGLVWGLLDLVLRGFATGGFLNPLQGFIEYAVAFAFAGLAGLLYASFQRAIKDGRKQKAIALGWGAGLIAAFAKFFWHFIAGWIYWGSYAPKGTPAWLYSLITNGGSAVVTGLLTVIVVSVLVATVPKQLFEPKPTTHLQSQA